MSKTVSQSKLNSAWGGFLFAVVRGGRAGFLYPLASSPFLVPTFRHHSRDRLRATSWQKTTCNEFVYHPPPSIKMRVDLAICVSAHATPGLAPAALHTCTPTTS